MTTPPKLTPYQAALREYAEVMADARPDEGHEESPEWDDEDDGWFNDPDIGDRS